MKRSEPIIPDASVLSGWRKSTYSGGSSDNCLEVNGTAAPAHIPVRDSKYPAGPALLFTASAWSAFVHSMKA